MPQPFGQRNPHNVIMEAARRYQDEDANTQVAQPAPTPAPAVSQPAVANNPSPAAQPEPVLSDIRTIPMAEAYNVSPAAPVPQPSQDDAQELMNLRRERDALRQELDGLKSAQEDARAARAELESMRDQQELNAYIAGLGSLGSVSAEDARKLVEPMLKSMKKEREQLYQTVTAQQAQLDARFAKMHEQSVEARQHAQLEKIYRAHPDLATLEKSKAYVEAMSAPVRGGSGLTLGQLVASEFQRGNTDFVIETLNQIKSQAKSPAGLMNVASVGGSAPQGGVATTEVDTTSDEYYKDLAKLNTQFSNRQISREQYRAALAKRRANSP